MASCICGTSECVACQEIDDRGPGGWPNRPSQPFCDNSYKGCKGSIGHWHLRSAQTSSKVECDGPASGGLSRNPGTLCRAIRRPFADGSNSAHGSRGVHRAMSGCWLLANSPTFFAKAPGRLRRRSYEFGLCLVSLGHLSRRTHSGRRSAERAGRGCCLSAHAVTAIPSHTASSRRREAALPGIGGERPRWRMSSRGGELKALHTACSKARLVCNV